MTRYYCSLADKNYVCKLLCLYDSLLRHSSAEFCLYILALDKETRDILVSLGLKQAIIVESWHVEKEMGLASIKAERTHQEFCWTMASQWCEFLMRTGLREITYLDADLFIFADPEPVFDEIGDREIAITPHRLIPEKTHLESNGAYNVGFVHFKSGFNGNDCLSRWALQVRERCSAQVGCGDQAYLDDFPLYGKDCCIIQNIGVNAGPWSIGNWTVTEGPRLDGEPLIAYHLHEFEEREDGSFRLTNYELRDADVYFIYRPYLEAYRAAKARIIEAHDNLNHRLQQLDGWSSPSQETIGI